jgi:KDO2-lipid IV(A) lauroyltransferase
VKFLGRWACTNKGLALLALKTGAPVIPLFSIRQNDGRYCIIFEDEVKPIHTGDKTKDIEENTALYTRIIERYVQKYPDQWFWFHRRWKTRMYWPIPENKTETIS